MVSEADTVKPLYFNGKFFMTDINSKKCLHKNFLRPTAAKDCYGYILKIFTMFWKYNYKRGFNQALPGLLQHLSPEKYFVVHMQILLQVNL